VLALCLPSATRARVPVLAEIPGEKLLADGDRRKLRLGLYLYAVSDAGVVLDYRSRAVTLDLERDAEHLRRGPLRYYAPLQLPPGRYRIRVLARDESLGRAGFQAVSLEVPESGTADPLLSSPPLFVAPDGGVSLRDGGDPKRSSSEPLELAGDAFVPQADPELTSGRPVKICLLLQSKPGETGDPGLELQARLRGEGREDWSPARVNVLGRTAPDLTGLWKVLVEFAPEGLAAGRYVFEVHVREQRSRRSSVSQAAFRVSG
jgi:hypothetical protein